MAPSFVVRDQLPRANPPVRQQRLNTFQRERLRGFLSGTPVLLDTLRLVGFQVQFSDSLMGGQPGSLRDAVHDSTWFANELKHLTQYFDGASRGNLVITWTMVGSLYTVSQPMGYYGDDAFEDVRLVELTQEVINLATSELDFSLYDVVMVIHAGAGQETDVFDNSREQIFSSFFDLADIEVAFPDSSVNGLATGDSLMGQPVYVTNFMMVPEAASQDGQDIGSLGIWAFEGGSRVGLLPLFDAGPVRVDSRGVGEFDLMSYGLFVTSWIDVQGRVVAGYTPSFPSAFNRLIAGWIDPILVDGDGQFRLHDINSTSLADTHCLRVPISESEYFLVVNRTHDTNFDSLFTFEDFDSNTFPDNTDSFANAEFDFFLADPTNPFVFHADSNLNNIVRRFADTGSGIKIWHIDEAVIRQVVDQGFLPNDFQSRKGVDLEEADQIQDMDGIATVFSFGSYFDSYRDGHNSDFGPSTDPNSRSNSGAETYIRFHNISAVDSFMAVSVTVTRPYSEIRTRWNAIGPYQPPTAFNLDAAGDEEIVVFADTGLVYAFNADGSEYLDKDSDPSTIEPYFYAPGAVWTGPPAFGDIDGGGDLEIIGLSQDGRVWAWKGDSTEVFDGDGDLSTNGVLYVGKPLAAPPMLLDVTNDGVNEVVIVERVSDSLLVDFVGSAGTKVTPNLAAIGPEATRRIHAQVCSPLAFGAVGPTSEDTEGILVVWADTSAVTYGTTYIPTVILSGTAASTGGTTIPAEGALPAEFPPTSSPTIADLDADGFEEFVFTIPDGRLIIGKRSSQGTSINVVRVRSTSPSAPAVGDTDGNGTLEIALWDDEYSYLYEHNGALYTNWPQPHRQGAPGQFPTLMFASLLTGPTIRDIDSDGAVEILYPTAEGTIRGYRASGGRVVDFPRVGPSSLGATPTIIDLAGTGDLSLLLVGSIPLIETIDGVSDTITSADLMVLSIQSLPGTVSGTQRFWTMYQHDARRLGRVIESNPLAQSGTVADGNTFIVYPNPVQTGNVNARIILNKTATVRVEIYNLEGQRALSQEFLNQNSANAIQTPFDETINIDRLVAGVYLMRIVVDGAGASEVFVKTFAVLR
ncbi:MAG: T9SS type A sorting domain-containing protein [bacterium]|nr:T9SS type A sorting domain-containing protein [bacterium]